MSQAIKEQSVYGETFREFSSRAGGPSWLARLREGAFERFEERGFPLAGEEDWKYTNVAPLARKSFKPATVDAPTKLESTAVEPFVYAEASKSRLAFVNGAFNAELSSLEAIPSEIGRASCRERVSIQ